MESETKLEDDKGVGREIVLRRFRFASNPQIKQLPAAQELFNSHLKGIQGMLWSDGWRPIDGMEPRLIFSKSKRNYDIFIACEPMLGQTVLEKPQTLSQIAHETARNLQ